jgi:pimeloyl-ACP methyl ester carboxylesterase
MGSPFGALIHFLALKDSDPRVKFSTSGSFTMNILIPVVVLILAFLLAGLIYQALAAARDRRKFPPPGRMVNVGGYRLHVNLAGDGMDGPTVIMDSGMVSFSSNWAWIQPEVAKTAKAVTYDRAGLGWSDPGPKPRDAGQSARELHAALEAASIAGPYVLAGHSYGGLVIRAFAVLYRDEVVGMVMVDASHPDQWVRFGFASRILWVGNKIGSLLSRFGVFRIFNKEYRLLADGLPPQAYAELMAYSSSPGALSASADAALAWDSITRPLINEAEDLGDIPLVVLSVTDQPRMGDKLTELQAELPGLSTDSKHITVEGAYHEGLVSQAQYAGVVTDAILQVVDAVRRNESLNGGGDE